MALTLFVLGMKKERRKISAAAEVAEHTANERSRTEMKQAR